MSARKAESTSATIDAAVPAWPWAELGRQQMAVAAEATSTWWSSLGAMRGIQEEALRDASRRQADATQKLASAATANEWMALQAELLRGEFEAATRYWQQIAGAALEMHSALLGCGAHLVDTEDAFAPFSPRFLHS